MGQINCQCQEVLLDDDCRQTRSKSPFSVTFSSEPTERQSALTQLILVNSYSSRQLHITEGEIITFGTTSDCQHLSSTTQGNQFKIAIRTLPRSLMIRDCGVGLGAFLLKKKIQFKKTEETFMSIDDKFVLISIGIQKIICKVFDIYGEESFSADLEREIEFKVG
jgi:hypothetical protein